MDAWHESNNRYLEISLQWLRLRLQRLIPEAPRDSINGQSTVETTIDRDTAPSHRFSRWRQAARSKKETRLLNAGNPPSLEEQIQIAEAKRAEAAVMDPPPALIMLSERFGLSEFERDTLFLCAAMEFDPGLEALFTHAHGHASRNHATFGLALSAFDNPSWDALSAHRPLRYARLIEINQPGAVPLTSSTLRADERVTNYLKGLNVLDDRLSSLLESDSANHAPLAPSQQAVADMILQRLQNASSEITLPIVQLVGADPGSRVAVARQVCAAVNHRLYRMMAESLPTQMAEIETLARLWQRESLLLPLALYIDVDGVDSISPEISAALHRFLAHEIGVAFIGVRETPFRLSAANFTADVNKPTAAEQCQAWTNILDEFSANLETKLTPAVLAGQFNFSLSDIQAAAAIAIKRPDEDKPLSQAIWESCRDLTRPRLDSLAQRLEPKATWNDLVLPGEQMSLMRHIAGQVRERYKVYDQWGFGRTMNRGFGISALFAGESGTGKTMAAEVLANDLQLNLYRIDLSAVVSKYIGETEKNLRKLFDAAERGGAILFFDEADALFGKRSEVKDSHDRYANIEINYLLQRMEAFSGLAILATNMKSALDAAFMRRLRFIVNLPFPGVKERQVIWQKALPPETPTRDLDYERLARLNLSGGNIHSIALNAAFMAAQNGQTVTMPILIAAARGELRKLEKGFSEAELR